MKSKRFGWTDLEVRFALFIRRNGYYTHPYVGNRLLNSCIECGCKRGKSHVEDCEVLQAERLLDEIAKNHSPIRYSQKGKKCVNSTSS